MAVAAKIAQLFLIKEAGSNEPAVQKDAVAENGTSQTWLPSSLVYTSGTGASVVLNGCATAATVVYGLSPDGAVGTGASVPPSRLFGTNHFPFDVRGRVLELNISGSVGTIGTTNGATWAGGGTNGVALAPGQQYGLVTPTTGAYKDMNFLDVSNTTQKIFEIIALAPGQATTDNNPRVWAKVIETVIQA